LEHRRALEAVRPAVDRTKEIVPGVLEVRVPNPPKFQKDECLRYSLGDEERVAVITGLSMCSLMFVVVSLLRGSRPNPPRPFLRNSNREIGVELPDNRRAVEDAPR
jgi:hypothetical protein